MITYSQPFLLAYAHYSYATDEDTHYASKFNSRHFAHQPRAKGGGGGRRPPLPYTSSNILKTERNF